MSCESTIRVQYNGVLLIDEGELINANIIVESGGTLRIINGGKTQCNYNDEIDIQAGGILEILSGEITDKRII